MGTHYIWDQKDQYGDTLYMIWERPIARYVLVRCDESKTKTFPWINRSRLTHKLWWNESAVESKTFSCKIGMEWIILIQRCNWEYVWKATSNMVKVGLQLRVCVESNLKYGQSWSIVLEPDVSSHLPQYLFIHVWCKVMKVMSYGSNGIDQEQRDGLWHFMG